MPDYAGLQEILDRGVREGVAPHVTLGLWPAGGEPVILRAGEAAPDTVYDLASLTKPLCTALLALELRLAGRLDWDMALGDMWGNPVPEEKKNLTLRRLLTHSSGLPAYRPYYQALGKQPAPTLRRGLLKAMLVNEPLEYAPGEKAVYSDLGYLLLGLLLEEGVGMALDKALALVWEKLSVEGPRFLPLDVPPPWPLERIAPCGSLPGRPDIRGQVEDENAHALGGVAGHAGLFGDAAAVARVMRALCACLTGGGPWPAEAVAELLRVDPDTPGSGRTPGFDTPSGPDSAAGRGAPEGTVGHLGFTGVSLWWHPGENKGMVLLTNRVARGRDNTSIHPFRRETHRLGWEVLG